jgi:hypothetical protein
MNDPDRERKYREMIVRFRQIQQRFEMSQTLEDRKAALEDLRKLSDESVTQLNHESR